MAEHDTFFEGIEKLLEVWFLPPPDNSKQADLRNISRTEWENLLKYVHCEIISEKQGQYMTAYVLSESSMFISKRRFILKTCGRTTLLHAVKPLLQLVSERCGMNVVEDIFYSRKNFQRPELQDTIHQSFEQEVALLDQMFENGAAYALGRLNGDCWYMYTIDSSGMIEADQTLELLMQDLDPNVMDIFTKDVSVSAKHATEVSGISDILPGCVIDDFLFDPCGYSMNGLLKDSSVGEVQSGSYFTIHVTPEPHCSYVSFETNIAQDNYQVLIKKLLNIFRPGRFLMTLFADKDSVARDAHKQLMQGKCLNQYERSHHQICIFKNFNLTYAHYVKPYDKVAATPPN